MLKKHCWIKVIYLTNDCSGYDFSNKLVFVTGGAGFGCGTCIVERFLKYGARVAFTGRTIESIEKVKLNLSKYKKSLFPYCCDISDEKSISKTINDLIINHGAVDILINNAASGTNFNFAENTTKETWQLDINTILLGSFYTCKYVIPHMKQKKYGKIIFISSSAALKGTWGRTISYSATKSALLGMNVQLAMELAEFNINVNTIIPSQINTPRVKKNGRRTEQSIKDFAKNIPLKRVGTAKDVANAVMFLSSRNASFITGQELVIDGGLSLTRGNKLF